MKAQIPRSKASLLITARFNAAKLLQSDINAWKTCDHAACVKQATCLGGPRGTCARTGGWPLCTGEGKERMKGIDAGKKWRRDAAYESETVVDRALRRQETRMAQMREEAMMADINALVASIKRED